MLLNSDALRDIERGAITLVFRRWRRPTVKTGGTLLTAIGQLAIEAVDVVPLEAITEDEARAAGFADRVALRAFLERRSEGEVYRIALSLRGPDPRQTLRETVPDEQARLNLRTRLRRLDAASSDGAWTHRVLQLIRAHPEERAASLAARCGMDLMVFKTRVRRLKALGLTESLPVGYRLSPRGQVLLGD